MIAAERKRWDERVAKLVGGEVEVNEITSKDDAEVNPDKTKPKRSRKKA